MGAPYALDLWVRVVAAVADGMSCAEAAEHHPSSRHSCERQTHKASSRSSGLSPGSSKPQPSARPRRAARRRCRSLDRIRRCLADSVQTFKISRFKGEGGFAISRRQKISRERLGFSQYCMRTLVAGRLGQPSTRAAAGGFGAGSRPLRPGKATTVAGTPRPLRECTP